MVKIYTYQTLGTDYKSLATARRALKKQGYTPASAKREGVKIFKYKYPEPGMIHASKLVSVHKL